MPQTNDELRAKFLTRTDDGIARCEAIICQAGGSIDRGWITYEGHDDAVYEAIQYLIEEWDYAYGPHPDYAIGNEERMVAGWIVADVIVTLLLIVVGLVLWLWR